MANLLRTVAQYARDVRSEGGWALPELSEEELDAVITGRASPVILSRFAKGWKEAKRAAWATGATWAMQDDLSDTQLKEIFERIRNGPAGK